DEDTSKNKEIDKLMALISLSFKKIYKPTNNNLRTSSNTSHANQDNSPRIHRNAGYKGQRSGTVAGARENVGSSMVQKYGIQCYNCKEYRHVARECQKLKRAKDATYHREKMLLSHYMYMSKIQEVSPDAIDSGPIFNTEPEQKVQNDDHYDVFAIECQHTEQSESVHNTYPIEQDAQHVSIESVDMNHDYEQLDQNDEDADLAEEQLQRRNSIEYASEMELECAKVREQADWKDDTDDESDDQDLEAHYIYMAKIQEVSPDAVDSGPIFDTEPEQKNDEDADLAKERELLASLIKKLKCKIDESKNHNKFLETSNKVLIDKLKSKIEDFKNKNKSLEVSNNQFKKANNKLSEENDLLYVDFKKSQAELKRRDSIEYATEMELECAKKEKIANPRLYDIGCYNDNLALMLAPESDEVIRLEKESRSKLSDLIKPFDYTKLNNLYDLFVP
nr:hypothetical protein [Tanacetum cinerariifolium]